MSSTAEAFVLRTDWSDASRQHPATKWMETYTRMFDNQSYKTEKWQDWFTDDVVLNKGDGGSHKGAQKAWDGLAEVYSGFTEYFHEPYYSVTIETSYGWELIGEATIWGNLPGERGEGEPAKVKDGRDGKQWDVGVPAAFRFQYEKGKGKHGMALKRLDLHADTMPIGMTLIKRGVIKL